MSYYTEQEISERTGFDLGETFSSPGQVRWYFNRVRLAKCLGDYSTSKGLPTQPELNRMAETVIENQWHCEFSPAAA